MTLLLGDLGLMKADVLVVEKNLIPLSDTLLLDMSRVVRVLRYLVTVKTMRSSAT